MMDGCQRSTGRPALADRRKLIADSFQIIRVLRGQKIYGRKKMKRKNLLIVFYLFCIAGLSLQPVVRFSSAQDISEQAVIRDGPYVFWMTEGVIVQYYDNGRSIIKKFEINDLIKIPGSAENPDQTYEISAVPPSPAGDLFTGAKKIFAISDLHGKFDQMLKLLKGNKIVDDNLHWNWQEGHLVIVGDIFDRGDKVNEALWFVHQLEKEAQKNGGMVHFILGNHEMMVLRGDLRYVHEKYNLVAKKFKIKIPDLYGPETELGRWLRSKNVMIVINDILFVHGGVSMDLSKNGYSMQTINKMVRDGIDLRDYEIRFNADLQLLFGSNGPFWSRNYFEDHGGLTRLTQEQVDATLSIYGAKAVVVGHTTVTELSNLYEGRVFAIETGIRDGAEGEAFLWENGKFYRAFLNGEKEKLR